MRPNSIDYTLFCKILIEFCDNPKKNPCKIPPPVVIYLRCFSQDPLDAACKANQTPPKHQHMKQSIAFGGLTEWLRSLIGNQVRCNSPVGSSPMSSAKRNEILIRVSRFFSCKRNMGLGPARAEPLANDPVNRSVGSGSKAAAKGRRERSTRAARRSGRSSPMSSFKRRIIILSLVKRSY